MTNIRQMNTSTRGPSNRLRADTLNADRETALHLLRSCFAAEISCFTEISRYLRDDSASSRELLEDILEMEQEHAAELAGMLQIHRLSALSRKARGAPHVSREPRLKTAASL